jgi:hypothetical protein
LIDVADLQRNLQVRNLTGDQRNTLCLLLFEALLRDHELIFANGEVGKFEDAVLVGFDRARKAGFVVGELDASARYGGSGGIDNRAADSASCLSEEGYGE